MIRSKWLKIIASVVFVIYLVFFDRAVTSPFMNKELTYVVEPARPKANPNRVVVTLPPSQVSGETHTRALRYELAAFGHVLAVSYAPELVERQQIVRQVFETLMQYFEAVLKIPAGGFKEVCLIGSSVGGQLAVDLDRYNRQMGSPLTITGLVIIDSPMDTSDVTIPGIKASKIVGPGMIANTLFGWGVAIWHNPPPPEQGADLKLLAEHHRISRKWPWSGIASAGRTICTFVPVQRGELAHIPNRALLRARYDRDVAASATLKWLEGLEVKQAVMVNSTTHCDWPAFPMAWIDALVSVLRSFYPKPGN